MNPEKLESIIDNILDAPARLVGHPREEILAFLEYIEAKRDAVGTRLATVDYKNLAALLQGTVAAPEGVEVYHERLHLCLAIDALKQFEKALAPPVVEEEAEADTVVEG